MSVTGKTLGVVAIGLVGLLVYLSLYVAGAYASVSGLGLAVAQGAIIFGLVGTAALMVIVLVLTAARPD